MKKRILFLLITILSLSCNSQISFEKGYYIDNKNQKINCLIKNIDWKSNPTEIEYKLFENSESKKTTIKSIKEFGIDNNSKYVRSIVNIDRSSRNNSNLSKNKKPLFKEEELFLKVLIDGKATLYQYVDSNLRRYFYNKESTNIKQLIFKSYITSENNIGTNNRFRQQLWVDLKCPNSKISRIENLKYKKNDLVQFFIEYSECHNNELVNFEKKQKRDLFNLTIRPRINNSSLTIKNSISNSRDTYLGNRTEFGFGLEAEFILPFNKSNWAITIEPTYQSFKSLKRINDNNVFGGVLVANIDNSSFEIPISLRHYFFLNNNSKIFINSSYIFDLTSKPSIELTRNDGLNLNTLNLTLPPDLGYGIGFGIGYKQNDKYSLEVKYQISREILSNHISWSAEYKTLSIIFGYSLF